LIDASASDLPEDLGQVLKRSMGEETGKPNLCAVARIGEKPIFPLSGQDLGHIDQITAGLRARFHGMLQATRLVRQRPSRKGKIDPRRLHGVTIGDPEIFLAHHRKPAINTAVHILLDSSGSMRERIGLASQCCHAVAQALEQSGISVGITAFPGEQANTVVPLLRHGEKVHHALMPQARGLTPMGEALWWVLQRLLPLPEERKIVLIVTDGSPDRLSVVTEAIASAKAVGIEVYGLGIEAPQIRNVLPQSSETIDKLQELPSALFSMLGQALLTHRRTA
jgi:uncharacterized protein YegL